MVPRELAETNRILPVLVRGDRMFLAMADPHEKRVVDELEFVTGKKVYPYIAVHSTLGKAIAAAYDAKARGESHYLGPQVPEETLRQLGLSRTPAAALASPRPRPAGGAARRRSRCPAAEARRAAPVPAAPRAKPRRDAWSTRRSRAASRTSEVSTSEFGVDRRRGLERLATCPTSCACARRRPPTPSSAGGGKLVLVVDDEEEIRKLLKRLLTQKGHRVIEADRGLLALRLVKDHMPDLIILDAMLPELHGFDIARRIKGSAKYGRIPIIMVSAVYRGWRIAEDLKQNYGVEEYLEKPFRITEPPRGRRSAAHTRRRALSAVRRETRSTSRPRPRRPYARASRRTRAGHIDEAIEHLKRGVGIDPLSYRLHFHLALLYGKKGQVYEGIQELERAIDLNPKHFPALKNLAVLYEKAGFKNKAVEMWERVRSRWPPTTRRARPSSSTCGSSF